MWNTYPQRCIPCAIFTKFAEFVPRFRIRQLLKVRWICSRGYRVTGFLSWRGMVTPKFSVPRIGNTVHQTPKSFGGARTCSRSSITMPSLVELGFHPPPGGQKRWFFCLSICLSIRHAFERQSLCPPFRHEGVGVQKRFWCRWIGEIL